MACPYLDYRDAADGTEFDHERAYCTAAEQFVEAMRADICNDRYALDHASHCEIYREHEVESEGSE
jgi:hypothetical protein